MSASGSLTTVFSAPFLGGSELFNLEYVDCVRSAGVGVDAIVPAQGALSLALGSRARTTQVVALPSALQRLSRFDQRVRRADVPALSAATLSHVVAMRRALGRTSGPICCFGFRAQLAVGALGATVQRRIVWVVHEVVPDGTFGRAWSRAAKRADAVMAYSRAAAEQPLLAAAEVSVEVYSVRLPLEPFLDVPAPCFPPRRVGLVGDLFPLKNHLGLIAVVERLRTQGLAVEGILVGRDPAASAEADYPASVRAAMARADGAVRLRSAAPQEMPTVMKDFDVLLHLSTVPETFGRVCAEAMAAARPVIAFDHGAVSEVVEHGKTGLLCPAGDLHAVVSSVRRLAEDQSLFGRMSRDARRRACQRFGPGVRLPTIGEALAATATEAR